jgi:hypothetical protein
MRHIYRGALVAAALLATTGAFAQESSANVSPSFKGVYNFRNVGGYRTTMDSSSNLVCCIGPQLSGT